MALTELSTECSSSTPLTVDEYTEAKLVEMVLRLMDDTNGEVKNAGVKAFVPLASTLASQDDRSRVLTSCCSPLAPLAG
jgi:hypothetical protein